MAKKEKKKKNESSGYLRAANFSSVASVIFLSIAFIVEILLSGGAIDVLHGILILAGLVLIISLIKTSPDHTKLGFNIPVALTIFYTILMVISSWNFSGFFLVCFAFCAISCLYSNINRTIGYVIALNIFIGVLIIRDVQVSGENISLVVTLTNWIIMILGSIILIFITRAATVTLDKALESQHSFRNLLATTENYIAMVDEHNEIVYGSNTLAALGNIRDSYLIKGRPFIDLFPGKTLKTLAGKLLKEKDNYTEDWEFFLNGQKRYFKAASHGLPGHSGESLISLYDMTHLAERDEIAVMKDSMKIGLFFMDQGYVIQDHYSRYLEEMLSEKELFGKLFTDIIANSVTSNELESIKDYFKMVIDRTYDQEMLDDINPLNELHYVNARTGDRKVFQCAFATVERARAEVFLLVTVYDITAKVELQQRLAEEEARRQEEMASVFELIQVQPDVFSDFMEDMEFEFDSIDKTLKHDKLTAHEALVKVYQSVHAIKSNAVILGLNVFGTKVHNLESNIKKLREIEGEVPFAEMLNLAMYIEKISQEKEGFRDVIGKLQSYAASGESKKQNVKVLIESLAKTVSRAAEDMGKQVKFAVDDIQSEAIDNGPRRIMKEILMQLIRNSVVHGIEPPDVRKSINKNETGTVALSIRMADDNKNILIKLSDDGKGLDYRKISERAVAGKIIKKEEANNKDMLIKAIFTPGFSTADDEGVHAGRGIGLNLVRDRIKEVNGTIKLRSDTGKGVLFFVSIPVVAKQQLPK
ncbi:MAG: ATP-binding protein [Treponema sp.]|nr:ATP-binding protein [Treponema sp.]